MVKEVMELEGERKQDYFDDRQMNTVVPCDSLQLRLNDHYTKMNANDDCSEIVTIGDLHIEAEPQRSLRRQKRKKIEQVATNVPDNVIPEHSLSRFIVGDEAIGRRAVKYEYLDHSADVQLHSWGDTLCEAFEQCAIAMFGYMTTLSTVKVNEEVTFEIETEGTHLDSLLYSFLDELLYNFSTGNYVVCKDVRISQLDEDAFRIRACGFGDSFDITKHPQGTEVKAITYSNMQIRRTPTRTDVYVIIDI